MFFPFTNFKKVDVPLTASTGGVVVYTTAAESLLYFVPIGVRMEDDSRIRVYVQNYFTDSDGGVADFYLYTSKATTATGLSLNSEIAIDNLLNINVGGIIPAGKNVIARVGDSSDKIGGTLYVFELP